MPLLPGETRESDEYVSGLSFLGLDRARENMRRWVDENMSMVGTRRYIDSVQSSVEQQYAELRRRFAEAQRTNDQAIYAQPSVLMGGHMVPAPINWEDENIWRSGLSTVLTVTLPRLPVVE